MIALFMAVIALYAGCGCALENPCAVFNEDAREWAMYQPNCSFKQAVIISHVDLLKFTSDSTTSTRHRIPTTEVLMLDFLIATRRLVPEDTDSKDISMMATDTAQIRVSLVCGGNETVILRDTDVYGDVSRKSVGITNDIFKCLRASSSAEESSLGQGTASSEGLVFELQFNDPLLSPWAAVWVSQVRLTWKETAYADPSVESVDSYPVLPPGEDAGSICAQQMQSYDGVLMSQISVIAKESQDQLPLPRVLCGLFSIAENHESNIDAIRQTWGQRCDGLLVFSTSSDARYNAVELFHEGPESYANMWQKTRAIWRHVHAQYLTQFDYFYLAGDDTFLIPENLVAFLGSAGVRERNGRGEGLYFGHVLKIPHAAAVDSHYSLPDGQLFNSGGSGYVLNAAAVSALMGVIDSDACGFDAVASYEDVLLGRCLGLSRISAGASGILPGDTRDRLGRNRFHPMAPGYHLTYTPPAATDTTPSYKTDWWNAYHDPDTNPLQDVGFDCCSDNSIAFHYIKTARAIREMYMFAYHCGH